MQTIFNDKNSSAKMIYQRLFDVGKKLLAESEVDELLFAAMDEAIAISGAERGLIILFDKSGKNIFQSARNLDKHDLENPGFEISQTIVDHTKKSAKPAFYKNAYKQPELKKSNSVSRLKILSVMCLPLKKGDEVFGVVYLDNRKIKGAFTEDNLAFLVELTNLISLAAWNALERKKLKNNICALEAELREKYQFDAIFGNHPKMMKIFDLIAQIADTDAIVLIQGESGTGKELVARALHFNSRRRDKPFVPINCGALPENLLESELFGHVKGAFTNAVNDKIGWFQQAEGGTIFLDEVSEMSPALQVKLLRILQTGEFSQVGSTKVLQSDVRIIAATNKKLDLLVEKGVFRNDLYYRLNVIDINLPPLRERRSDIPLLIEHFIDQNCKRYDKNRIQLSKEAASILSAYDYPGNCRELENIIQHAVLLAKGNIIYPEHLPKNLSSIIAVSSKSFQFSKFKTAKSVIIEKFEKEYITDCLETTQGHITNAAKLAGLDLKNFYEKMKRYNINPSQFKA